MSLNLLFPKGKEVTISNEVVTVKPFMFGQLPDAIKLLHPVITCVAEKGLIVVDNKGILNIAPTWPLLITGIMAEIGEDVLALCCFVIKRPREFFNNVEMDEGALLLLTIFMVNADFFKARIITGLNNQMIPVPIGSTVSQPLSVQGTEDTK